MLRSPVVVITRACLPDLMRELDRVAADGLGMAALCVGEQRLHGSHRDHGGGVNVVEAREDGSQRTSGDRPAARLRSRMAARQTMASCTGGSAPLRHAVPLWTTGTRCERFRTYGARPRWTPFCARHPGRRFTGTAKPRRPTGPHLPDRAKLVGTAGQSSYANRARESQAHRHGCWSFSSPALREDRRSLIDHEY